jgi:hypothetical protein
VSIYERKANKFLDRFGLVIHADFAGDNKCPPWCNGSHGHGEHYRVSVMDKDEHRRPITFDFWSSEKAKENGDRPTNYSILLSLAHTLTCPTATREVYDWFNGEIDRRNCVRMARFSRKVVGHFTKDELKELEKFE